MDVVDKIKTVATGNSGMHQNVPNQAIVIKEAVLLPAKAEKKAEVKKDAKKDSKAVAAPKQ